MNLQKREALGADSHPEAWRAFVKKRRVYGFDADGQRKVWHWFLAGWVARASQPSGDVSNG